MVRLVEIGTGAEAAPLDWRGGSGSPLDIADLLPFDPAAINQDEWSLWRYAAMLPAQKRFSLGAGMTPLVPVTVDGYPFRAKLDYLNPTGSYKDRGTEVLVNHLLAYGVKHVVEDSSGNAGSSLAMVAAGAGMHARIFVPANAPITKKRQIAQVAALVEVPGPRSAVTDACLEAAAAPGTVYATHAWSPFFLAGQMTGAWELWEQLGRRAPEAVACPVGMGVLLLGLVRGFDALHAAGLIDRVPRFFAVQTAACDPVVRAYESGAAAPIPVTPQPTTADGIVVANPVRGAAVMAAIYRSGGAALRVEEVDILPARQTLALCGLLVEPTSATTIATLPQIRQHYAGDDLVVILTGNGLKTLDVGR